MAMLGMLVLLAFAAVANLVHGKEGIAYFLGGGRPDTWLITLAAFVGIVAIAGYAVKSRWDGVFIDKDNRISLSRFQLIVWTVLLVSALFTVGLINAMPPTVDPAPLAIDIPPEIWALLGLGAFTAVAAPAIKEGKRQPVAADGALLPDGIAASPVVAPQRQINAAAAVMTDQNLAAPVMFEGRVLVKTDTRDARWVDLILGDYEGAAFVDVSKLQQLAFTVLLVIVYAMNIWTTLAGTANIHDFPAVDPGFIALLGISHAAYLADKQVAST